MQRSTSAAWIAAVACVLAGCSSGGREPLDRAALAAPDCSQPGPGCACEEGAAALPCFAPDEEQDDGTLLCREGTMTCRSGRWSACEDLRSYAAPERPELGAIVDPGGLPRNCSSCDVKCFSIVDPLLAGPATDGGVAYGSNGGLQLAPGMGTVLPVDGGAPLTGCDALANCCTSLSGAPAARDACRAVVSADNDTTCQNALGLYCPMVVTGPVNGCVRGAVPADMDCDGIPDSLDACTAETIDNPACNGSVLPLPSTNNQTLFHVLDRGETGRNAVQIAFQVKNADIYFLMDMSDTMTDERDKLVSSMNSGNVVECALLQSCCEKLPAGTTRTACETRVKAENQANCRTDAATYCASNPALAHCADVDFDGFPDDTLKDQGVVGAVRCLLGNSWFGAGNFIEIPVRQGGLSYRFPPYEAWDTALPRDRGNTDENAFRHFVDMTRNIDRVQGAIQRFKTNRNYEYPESQIIALWSLLTGEGQTFGHLSTSIPRRNGAGCPADTFGYPCFRKSAIPIVVLFTDDPLNNGPSWTPPRYQAAAVYDANYNLNGKAPTSGFVQYTPAQAETFLTALNLTDVGTGFVAVSGNLADMLGDYPSAVTGCAADAAGPEAVYRFQIASRTEVKFAMNTAKDGNGYDDSYGDGNAPSPATEVPVVVSVYSGEPSNVGAEIDVTDTRVNPIATGPDRTYLTYKGTSAGPNSQNGLLGGLSGCRADGKTNQVAFTFRPTSNARLVFDAAQSSFQTVLSLHDGTLASLPANPSGDDAVTLSGAQNSNDSFDTAIDLDGADRDGTIDGYYITYIGDLAQLRDSGTGSVNTAAGRAGVADYEAPIFDCAESTGGPDAVFRFHVGSPVQVRIDSEGSLANTAIALYHANSDPLAATNILGCDTDIGPNGTGLMDTYLEAGTYYVVVKADGAGQAGSYQLNIRDVAAYPDKLLYCTDSGNQLMADVVAGRDYTLLLKGGARFEQGAFRVKMYDPNGLDSTGAQLLDCRTICPDIDPFRGSPAATRCTSTERTTNAFSLTLDPGTHYVTVKSRFASAKGFYELQIGDSTRGSSQTKYVPKTWSDLIGVLSSTGAKVLPVLSCSKSSDSSGRCAGAEQQLREVARQSGAKDKNNIGLTRFINPNGTGIGSGLASAVRDLANYLSMDITLSPINNPGFSIGIQKCTDPADPLQAECEGFTTNCQDTTAIPRNRIRACAPGAVPKFVVEFTNPLPPNSVRPNPSDPNGGYLFKLQILGADRFLLEEIPVYIIPTAAMGPPIETGGPGSFQATGTYEQQFFGVGCSYYQIEGEGAGANDCDDGIDNNGDGKIDRGIDNGGDGDFTDMGDAEPDPGCSSGSCADGINNDQDSAAGVELTDFQDPDCATNSTPDWTDLFFEADVPDGTSIDFALCTGASTDEVDGCSFSDVATVTSAGDCRLDADCRGRDIGGGVRKDGFCGVANQCLFITPPKLGGMCSTDADCPNGDSIPRAIASICDTSMNRCRYVTPPVDVAAGLPMGANGKAFAKLRVTLNANADASRSPALYNWEVRYVCRDVM